MKRLSILAFTGSGLSIGIVTTAIGQSFPTIMAVGAGPLFLVCLLLAIAMTSTWSKLSSNPWRYALALVVSLIGYVFAVLVFSLVSGYSPEVLNVKPSHDITDFGLDVLCGLLSAALVAAIFAEVLVSVMTVKWSFKMFLALAVVGVCCVLVSAVGREILLLSVGLATPTYRYWSFFGVLFGVTEALFASAIGFQLVGGPHAELDTRRS